MIRFPQTRDGWILLAGVALAIGLVVISLSRQVDPTAVPDPLVESPAPGFLAPNFELVTLDGESIQLSDLRGRPVVLNFWASWCGPCRIETPHFQEFSENFEEELIVLGVNQQESAATVAEFAAEYDVTYPLLLDDRADVYQTYAIFGLPTTYFIDADGVIVDVIPGAATEAVLTEKVEALLLP